MATKEGSGPAAPMDPKVVGNLLNLLSSNDEFRQLFSSDPHAALVQAGYEQPDSAALRTTAMPMDAAVASGASCLRLSAGCQLASKEDIAAARSKLETSLNAIQDFDCPLELQAR